MQLLHYDLTSKNQRQASVDVYLKEIVQENPQPLPIVVICPGGGYRFVSNRESEPLALGLTQK
ncbi:alpha/beta hydrolase [Enterococcus cecorum]|nr:alpha/beta hydrolase [Enterococcus cecorum]